MGNRFLCSEMMKAEAFSKSKVKYKFFLWFYKSLKVIGDTHANDPEKLKDSGYNRIYNGKIAPLVFFLFNTYLTFPIVLVLFIDIEIFIDSR